MFRYFLDIFAPKKCYSCKEEGYFICEKCMKKEKHHTPHCYVCKKNNKDFSICPECKRKVNYDKIIIPFYYSSKLITRLIIDAKFFNRTEIFEDLSRRIYDYFLQYEGQIKKENYLIIGVPTTLLRRLKRGYNPSQKLCQYFSGMSSIEYRDNIVKKIRNTKQQSHLNREERLNNLKDSFCINPKYREYTKNKTIIILDDVVSTGSTINEIAGVLKSNGVKEVIGLVIASG